MKSDSIYPRIVNVVTCLTVTQLDEKIKKFLLNYVKYSKIEML